VGIYQRYLAPRVVDTLCSPVALAKWRAPAVKELSGVIVECGFGAGHNLAYYPESVSEIIAIEPSDVMRRRASSRIVAASMPVRWGGRDGQILELDDDVADAAVITFSLCTIADPLTALTELRRVVKTGGELRVLEHGLAPDDEVRRWQRRLNRLEMIVADGCQLTRDPLATVQNSPWKVTSTFQKYVPGPKPWSYFTSLRAQ
jgi:ubiquinone/menaquinone biosynthesis C-methylase UbiE